MPKSVLPRNRRPRDRSWAVAPVENLEPRTLLAHLAISAGGTDLITIYAGPNTKQTSVIGSPDPFYVYNVDSATKPSYTGSSVGASQSRNDHYTERVPFVAAIFASTSVQSGAEDPVTHKGIPASISGFGFSANQSFDAVVVADSAAEAGASVVIPLEAFVSYNDPGSDGSIPADRFASSIGYAVSGGASGVIAGVTRNSAPDGTVKDTVTLNAKVGDTIRFSLGLLAQVDTKLWPPYHQTGVASLTMNGKVVVQGDNLSVVAEHDNNPSATVFGNYIPGVALPDTFTVTPSGGTKVAKVTYSVDGKAATAATPKGNGTWTFDPSVALLVNKNNAATDHPLTVTSYDAAGKVVATFTGKLVSQAQLTETLKVTPPGGTATDPSGIRFLQSVPFDGFFQGTLADLPDYYIPSLELRLDTATLGGVTKTPSGAGGVNFSFHYDTAKLAKTDVTVFPAFGTAGTVGGPDAQVHLHSTPLPSWMDPTEARFNQATQAYSIDLTFPRNLSFALPTTSGTPFGLFDGLATNLLLGVHLNVSAKLTTQPDDAKLSVKDWFASAVVLDKTILDAGDSLSPDLLSVTAELDPYTLAAPQGFTLTTAAIDLLKPNLNLLDTKFGSGGKPFEIPTPGPFGANLSLDGRFTADVAYLNVKAGLKVDVSGPTPVLVPSGTFLEVATQASSSLVLYAQAGLGLKILTNAPFVSFVAAGGVSAVADLDVRVDFSGPITSPRAALNTAASKAGITVGYGFDYDYAFFSKASTADLKPVISSKGPYPLFGLAKPAKPSFDALNALILAGPGDAYSPGFPGVAPAKGSSLPILGDTTGITPKIKAQAAPAAAIRAASAPSPTSRLTVRTPLVGTVTGVKFDADVLADRATLTPGRHFLDAVLVGSDGDEIPLAHVDLAGRSLSANANPLGFAGGWVTVTGTPASPLRPGAIYEVEFRLTTDAAGTGERVAVALDNLVTSEPAPKLAVSGPDGVLNGTTIDYGGGDSGVDVATVRVANSGQGVLALDAPALAGAGFAVVNPTPSAGVLLLPGDSLDLKVRRLDPATAASGTLTLHTDDPARPALDLTLKSAGTPAPPAPPAPPVFATVPDASATLGQTVALVATASEAGHAVTYSLDPGAPDGAAIDPATGAFSWRPTAAGVYRITVRATDDRPSPLSATSTFSVTVQAATVTPPATGSGYGPFRDAFVTSLYGNAFGRVPEPSGLRFWSSTLFRGVPRRAVARSIWASPERRGLASRHAGTGVHFGAAYSAALAAARGASAGAPAATLFARSIGRFAYAHAKAR